MSLLVACILCSSLYAFFFFFNDTATTEIYTLSLHDALPISYCPTGSTAVMTTFSLPSTSTSCPGPCPFTSAEGECTRRYSNGNSKRLPSVKLTSSMREARRRRISVAMGLDMGFETQYRQ